MIKTLFIFGTRPEAIKLCPVLLHQRDRRSEFEPRVCVTAQHRHMLDQVLSVFDVEPDHDLNVMQPGQTLFQSTSRMIAALEGVLTSERPDMVIVQGDTTTTLCGALAGFYLDIPVAHVEAGLRTFDMRQPFPEEMNRVITTRLSRLNFAATEWARDNLLAEGVDSAKIFVTGNPGIDAVLYVRDGLERGKLSPLTGLTLDNSKKLVVVTAHRRESFGEGFERICSALARLATRDDVQIVYPVHPNPNVQGPVNKYLASRPNVLLIQPLTYVPFVDLMRRAHILLTDSGGVQEEGPSLGKPILVMREKTERPEAVIAGTVKLVGTDEGAIYAEASRLLEDTSEYERMARIHNPYGDGQASERIADGIMSSFHGSRAAVETTASRIELPR
ncbi:MAG: UDP-N-acetylglucosamine 2-epimerase (non-hydrolyzing) [Acidobacteriaceae bacterium]|nr:UDP-N-acetylglucosamine 2-epimerase (non-hydrolyzing) [Acidobacteriaceae bacterium]MBV9502241.1 UDP-N-acetylglucosamine 2-epimerase (non-hydrolyzing) [Acidobacteriaceae bacterium]